MKSIKSISCYALILLLLSPTLLYSYSCPSGGIPSQIVTCSESTSICISPTGLVVEAANKDECVNGTDNVYVSPSNDFQVSLSLLATGQFTLNAWFDENVNLWDILVVNPSGVTMPDGNAPNFALKFELRNSAISSDPLVSAFYIGEDLTS